MAYQTFKKRNINYLNKDFADFRQQLINYSQTYFPTSYTDFSETSPGMMFMEQTAYVGDVLGFYIDNQVQENFIQYARQTTSLFDLAYMFGYKPKVTGLASTEVTFYQLVPAVLSASVYVPDYDYTLLIPENTTVNVPNTTTTTFTIEDPVDFSVSNSLDPTEVSIAQVAGGNPTYYLLSKTAKALSGTIKSVNFTFGAPQEFPTVIINDSSIAGIVDVFDADNNEYYEVDYLGQDMIYDSIRNTNVNDPNNYTDDDTPYILKLKSVQRRFNTRFLDSGSLQLQFGSGNNSNVDEEIVPNPMNVGLGLPYDIDKLTTAFSPTNFIFTDTYGIAPSNTTLTVRYYQGGGVRSNLNANQLTGIDTSGIKFNQQNLNATTAQFVFDSIQVNNKLPASGGNNGDTAESIRQNVLSSYGTQLRNVTQDDYLVRALSMPPQFGVISKAYTAKPEARTKSTATLCIYVLSTNIDGNLTTASTALKTNLKTYLNEYRMIGDSIDIKDAYIINIAVDYEIITLPDYNSNEVLTRVNSNVQQFFQTDRWQINQPIILSELNNVINLVPGVQTCKKVIVSNKAGTTSGYSQYAYDIEGATQDGTIYPSMDYSIFEVKFPDNDIKGRTVNI
tara:strand:+ start:5255 stop:7111 length:1857 start_codon:yes stop_codon:yes gene_type:complete